MAVRVAVGTTSQMMESMNGPDRDPDLPSIDDSGCRPACGALQMTWALTHADHYTLPAAHAEMGFKIPGSWYAQGSL